VGDAVGYSVRFDNRTGKNTSIKVMTDGILLAEMQRDRDLRAYDCIIVDEAHERSLNIDFLLGYLHRLASRRRDLKIVITSATIDTHKIAAHFGDAPIIEVSGRNYPVEIRYQPRIADNDTIEVTAAVREAVAELTREGSGDILVFSSGEREINDVCESLRKHEPTLEVLPLYARLSTKEQQRIFSQSSRRRVIVSTNVAETSLTVPGIRYVIDIGEARISRFSQRTKVQRLPIEAISQASANQRSGRCGRLGPGIAIRLYDEDDFNQRPEFTEPEIQRTNLAAVILMMAAQRLGSPHDFPFIDPPDSRSINDGIRLLHELQAVESTEFSAERDWLTDTGRSLARMPIDPRLGAMVLAGDHEGCLHEATIVAAALAVQDPRERPREKQKAADQAHIQFTDDRSDILTLLHLWHAGHRQRRDLSRRQFQRWCRDRFLHAQRMNEWFDTIAQLRQSAEELGLANSYSSDFDVTLGPGIDDNDGQDIHRAILVGLLSQIGMRVERGHEYLGPRSAKFAIQPGSTCFDDNPPWIMAATLVETTRLWARTVAPIDPTWVEEPAAHLTTVEAGDIWWGEDSGTALTTETVRLYGLPIVADRVLSLDHHDPVQAREMFIHNALIEGRWPGNHRSFVAMNASVRHEARNLAARSTQRSFDDEYDRVWSFYDRALPAHVTGTARFNAWFDPLHADDPHLLEMSVHDLISPQQATIDETSFPEAVDHGGVSLTLDYQSAETGIAVDIPVTAVATIEPTSFVGIVPGRRREAVIALVRALPKQLRKKLVPVPETVDAVLDELGGAAGVDDSQFAVALRHALERRCEQPLPFEALDPRTLPPRLRPQYRVVDDDGNLLAEGPDVEALQAALDADIKQALSDGASGVTHPGATDWQFGELPARVSVGARQGATTAYPSLVDYTTSVGVELVPDEDAQRTAMWSGTRRLLRLTVASPLRAMNDALTNEQVLALPLTPHGDRKAWFEDLALACLGSIIDDHGVAWNAADFDALQATARKQLPKLAREWAPVAATILAETAAIRMALAGADRLPPDSVRDAREHLERLTFPGHLSAIGLTRFHDLVRYLRGIGHRLDRLALRPDQDHSAMLEARAVESAYDTMVAHLRWSPALEAIAWSLEELRISLFAQHLGTTEKVSPTRLRRRLEKLAVA